MRIKLLVTVKAYPAISQKYGEVVCVAGVRLDTPQPEWVRLFPIPFRDMHFDQRFSKYQVISVDVERPRNDKRPESWTPNVDTLEIGEKLDTKHNWSKRRPYVEPLEVESMCEIRRRQELDGTSLGVFKPADISMTIEDDAEDWDAAKAMVAAQPSLFFPNKKGLEKIPYRFKYNYRCSDPRCGGHSQSIVDWEIAATYRNWNQYAMEERLARISEQWTTGVLFADEKNSRLFVGNQHQHPDSFLVLGVFYPKVD